MNRISLLVSGIFLLINFACQKEIKQKKETAQKSPKKYSFVVKRNTDIINFEEISKNKAGKPLEFFKIVESFQPQTFSLDELIDMTDKDLKIIKSMNTRKMTESLDTASIKSRMVLTEVYLRKLKYLIHKTTPQKDTINRTLDAIINNLNSVISQMKIYNGSTDEFESILKHDSIARQQKQLLNDTIIHESFNLRKNNHSKYSKKEHSILTKIK